MVQHWMLPNLITNDTSYIKSYVAHLLEKQRFLCSHKEVYNQLLIINKSYYLFDAYLYIGQYFASRWLSYELVQDLSHLWSSGRTESSFKITQDVLSQGFTRNMVINTATILRCSLDSWATGIYKPISFRRELYEGILGINFFGVQISMF